MKQLRGRSYQREQRRKAIERKKRIIKYVFQTDPIKFTNSKIGKLSKGKIHCSCSLCKYEKRNSIEKEKYKETTKGRNFEEYY